MKHLFYFSVLLLFNCYFAKAETDGFEIKVRIKNLANKEIILGHHFAEKLYPDDTLKLDQTGYGILKGQTKYPEGIYFFLTPAKKMFDFFMTDNQRFSVETDTLDLFENLKFINSPENLAIWKYQKNMMTKQKEAGNLQEKKKNLTDEKDKTQIDAELKKISKEVENSASELIDEQKNNFVGTFMKAVQEIDIPEPPKDAQGKILDSLFQYRYYRSHFFDNFNISDSRLLRTPIYEGKIKKYIENVIPQIPDSINPECDKLLTEAEKDKEVFRYMLITLFNYYATSQIMGFDAVYAHLAEKWYIPKATFSDTAFIRTTRENVEKLNPLLLGKVAPDLHMLSVPSDHFIMAQTDSLALNNPHIGSFIDLKNVSADYTILAFWESDCSHCKTIIPELHEVYQRLKSKGVKVFAVHMLGGIEGKKKWMEFVNEHQLYDWMNVWNPYDFGYKKIYDIRSTPMIYILDKDKKIIGKRLEPKQIEEFIDNLIKQKKK